MTVKRGKETFSGFNKPKRTPNHPTKSHVVLAKEGDKVKLIRFGQQGVSGAGKNPKSEKQKARRKSFLARHQKNIAKGKMSAAFWAAKDKRQYQYYNTFKVYDLFMSEENQEMATPPENNAELEQLKESVKKLEAKNY